MTVSAEMLAEATNELRAVRAERDALAERADALHKALREYNIGYSYAGDEAFARDDPCGGHCSVCQGSWRMPGDELHADGCLAAPSAPSTGGA